MYTFDTDFYPYLPISTEPVPRRKGLSREARFLGLIYHTTPLVALAAFAAVMPSVVRMKRSLPDMPDLPSSPTADERRRQILERVQRAIEQWKQEDEF